jgi:hypothetical protein
MIPVIFLFCLAGTVTSPYHWPSEGVVCFKNVKMRYQPHLPHALKGKPAFSALSCPFAKHLVPGTGHWRNLANKLDDVSIGLKQYW